MPVIGISIDTTTRTFAMAVVEAMVAESVETQTASASSAKRTGLSTHTTTTATVGSLLILQAANATLVQLIAGTVVEAHATTVGPRSLCTTQLVTNATALALNTVAPTSIAIAALHTPTPATMTRHMQKPATIPFRLSTTGALAPKKPFWAHPSPLVCLHASRSLTVRTTNTTEATTCALHAL